MRLGGAACVMRPRYFRRRVRRSKSLEREPTSSHVLCFSSHFHFVFMPLIADLLSTGGPKTPSTLEDGTMMPDVEQGVSRSTKNPGRWRKIRYSLDIIYTPKLSSGFDKGLLQGTIRRTAWRLCAGYLWYWSRLPSSVIYQRQRYSFSKRRMYLSFVYNCTLDFVVGLSLN